MRALTLDQRPPALCAACARAHAGIPLPDSEERWSKALEAIKGVWASKYNDRAYISLRKVCARGSAYTNAFY